MRKLTINTSLILGFFASAIVTADSVLFNSFALLVMGCASFAVCALLFLNHFKA